jgi:hypothetical protein
MEFTKKAIIVSVDYAIYNGVVLKSCHALTKRP